MQTCTVASLSWTQWDTAPVPVGAPASHSDKLVACSARPTGADWPRRRASPALHSPAVSITKRPDLASDHSLRFGKGGEALPGLALGQGARMAGRPHGCFVHAGKRSGVAGHSRCDKREREREEYYAAHRAANTKAHSPHPQRSDARVEVPFFLSSCCCTRHAAHQVGREAVHRGEAHDVAQREARRRRVLHRSGL